MARILVLEDDPVINQVVCEFLKEEGHEVESFVNGRAAYQASQESQFDLLILDIMVPEMTGLEVLQEVRKKSTIPILMLTALGDECTQLLSFNQQISDYVTKPFSPLILMKRVENILRQECQTDQLVVGNISLSEKTGMIYDQGKLVSLTQKEYAILHYLIKHKDQIVSRDGLMLGIWGYTELDSRVLDNHIKNLRKKLPDLPLKTVIGRGYQLET
ncbi:response regulator transcription factor [Streptococcus sp. A27]|uniref:response regulator transcription factor n=1 Tax=unclassified Streptococcus TaxID=2608887 RepID=UPI001554E1EF|nr:response regulator transcription factor [Streptococcus suis]